VTAPLATRLPVALPADPGRVLAKLFVPGHELVGGTQSRATGVLARLLAMPDETVARTLQGVRTRYAHRHRDFEGVLAEHARLIAHRVPDGTAWSSERTTLLGAYFTHEFALEAAALFNPSVVAGPDQSGLGDGELRFVMSLRAVGEGHLSSVEFRSGVLARDGTVRVDEPGTHAERGRVSATTHVRSLFGALLAEGGADEESTRYLLSRLPERFDEQALHAALGQLAGQHTTRLGGTHTDELARRLVGCAYEVTFPPETGLAERVLWPEGPAETHGMEDVRLVRFTGDDGSVDYRGTYTAFDGEHITPQSLQTTDFLRFRISQLSGRAATNKGMALFPRTVGGRHLALSRWDRESCSVASSDDGLTWGAPETVHVPQQPWELIQTGNCGSPLETEAGWLVLTHGVGPLREYAIGALLLDLDEPTTVLGVLREPLLTPGTGEREGYVPNVVYSCGALLHEQRLLLPYGASDASVRFAVVDVPELLRRIVSAP
jgi:predicted GH43/DUF377 family glycosyl hydrolase